MRSPKHIGSDQEKSICSRGLGIVLCLQCDILISYGPYSSFSVRFKNIFNFKTLSLFFKKTEMFSQGHLGFWQGSLQVYLVLDIIGVLGKVNINGTF